MTEQDFKFDTRKLPQRIDLEIPGDILKKFEDMAARTGRDLNEILVEFLDKGLEAGQ